MDEKIRSVLENEELLAKIAAAVRGTAEPSPAPPQSVPTYMPSVAEPVRQQPDAVALLAALKPFLRQERREKLDSITKALSVASVYKNIKGI